MVWLLILLAVRKKEMDLVYQMKLVWSVGWSDVDKVDSEGVLNLLVTSEKKFIGVVKIIDEARFSDVGKD